MKKFLSSLLACVLILALCCPAMADGVLRPGAKGEAVKVAQRLLKKYGYYGGSIDGSYGSQTTQAVRQFQVYNDLTVDGKIGPKTNAKLTSNNAVSAPKSPETGSDAAIVTNVQTLLKQYGYYTGKINGLFNDATEKALRSFQQYNRLTVNGQMNAETLAILTGANVVKAPVVDKTASADAVKHIQERLQFYGYYNGKIDGVYGTGSIAAVKAFQRANDLKVDGAVGKNTLAKLDSDNAVKQSAATDKETLKDYPILRKNATGKYVKTAQNLLRAAGFYSGSIDGKYVGDTIKAVKAYQKSVGLEQDGKVGANTWAMLLKLDPSIIVKPTEPVVKDDGVLRPGDKGDAVKALQEKLIALGYKLTADGVYGDKTTAAVRRFQKANGLKEDGKAGPATMTMIDAKLAAKQ